MDYKNILLNSITTEGSNVKQPLSYDVWLDSWKAKSSKEPVPKRPNQELLSFLDNKTEYIHEFVEKVKVKYGESGIGNELSFSDLYNILLNSLKVEIMTHDVVDDVDFSACEDEEQN